LEAQSFWWIERGRGELRLEQFPDPRSGQVLVRTLATGVSRGTERLVANGQVPESEWPRMRCPHQVGSFPFPVKYGYTAVGVVEDGPPDLLGRKVFCLHPHQSAFVVAATAVRPIPFDIPTDRALLAANMETALNATWDAPVFPGQRIVVLGAGVVGTLFAYLAARVPGTDVTLCDPLSERAEVAEAIGAEYCHPDAASGDADLVVEASGNARALGNALELAGFEGTVLALSWYGSATASLPLGSAFHSRRLRLVGSQVGAVAPLMRPRWDYARRMAKALELLDDPVLDMLIGQGSAFEDLPTDMPRILADPGMLMHPIRYGSRP